jgi:glycosyltransferase involved in cell wall biosynthesis
MIRLFVNAVAASAGGGVTYVRNVLPHLSRRTDVRATVALAPSLKQELPSVPNVAMVECSFPGSAGARFWSEQKILPDLIREHNADILLAAGNFAVWKSPVPQILLSRNSLYVSADYSRDLLRRHEYARWLDTKMKGRLAAASVRRADVTVAPSEAFAADLRQWVGPDSAGKIVCIHHGFDAEAFRDGPAPPAALEAQLANAEGALRLLFVSNYTHYRNFETLLRALPLIQAKMPTRRVQLVLTCKLGDERNPGGYSARQAAALRDQLQSGGSVLELGPVPYPLLHYVYKACDIYVTPAYAETFAHPLVEAMSSGLAVIASDLPVHREICGDAASYFPAFVELILATEVARLESNVALRAKMSQAGLGRSQGFSWERHVDELLQLAGKIQAQRAGGSWR